MKIAYIAHPVGGDVEGNLEKIRSIVKRVNIREPNTVPFVPYYADCVSLDDSSYAQRMRGIKNDKWLLGKGFVDEVRLYGNRISDGMKDEVLLAQEMGITVIAMTDETKLELKDLKNKD